MPEYVRKKRYVNYYSNKCKKYLRIDFNFQCAYCKTSESEVIMRHKVFEIDHFRPQEKFRSVEDVHRYDNLFYSCKICNGKSGKSDKWHDELLNPCIDKIYGKENNIVDIGKENNFKLKDLTAYGKLYIEIFNLNQIDQRKIRRARWELKEKNERKRKKISLIESQILELKAQNNISIDIVSQLFDTVKELNNELPSTYGPYTIDFKDEETMKFERDIGKYVNCKDIYSEYDLDYELEYDGQVVKCDVHLEDNIRFTNGVKYKKISVEKAIDWSKLDFTICMIIYDINTKTMYYSNLSKILSDFEVMNKKYLVIPINENDEITIHNIDKFYTDIFSYNTILETV